VTEQRSDNSWFDPRYGQEIYLIYSIQIGSVTHLVFLSIGHQGAVSLNPIYKFNMEAPTDNRLKKQINFWCEDSFTALSVCRRYEAE
jgi:hypothetical protein